MKPEFLDLAFLKTLTVLLVEDDPQALEEIAVFLRRRVGTLLTATDGSLGLAAFGAGRPQLVLTDIQMPHLDGLGLVEQIRALDPGVPVIILTAFEQADYLLRSIELGIDRYLLKPIQLAPLEAALQACAHRLRAEHELRLQEARKAQELQTRNELARCLLLGGLAHDYNNLLQAILSSVDMARRIVAPGIARRLMEVAMTSAEEAQILAKRLSSLGQPCELSSELNSEPGDLEPLIRTVPQEALAGTPVALVFNLHAGARTVQHNPAKLAQVLRNLAENAREAMPEGGTLRISTEIHSPAGAEPSYRIGFQDSGRGIAAEHLPLVFEPYFSTKEKCSQRGTGLGLALCEAIVRAHGGTITAQSPDGGGATFIIDLPLPSSAE